MEAIEDNRGPFPRTEICTNCKSTVEINRCRDAYWKIAGEEMELGKSWEPDYNDFNKTLSMYCLCGKFGLSVINPFQFVFPSKEMRDEFAENFKKDIDSCK